MVLIIFPSQERDSTVISLIFFFRENSIKMRSNVGRTNRKTHAFSEAARQEQIAELHTQKDKLKLILKN